MPIFGTIVDNSLYLCAEKLRLSSFSHVENEGGGDSVGTQMSLNASAI